MFVFAAICIALALILYSLGVWSEKMQRYLKLWHVVVFWVGLALDTTGTMIMGKIAGSFSVNLHSATGALAIIVMTLHVFWATVVLRSNNEEGKVTFNKYSVLVWFIWLVPVFVGMLYGVGH